MHSGIKTPLFTLLPGKLQAAYWEGNALCQTMGLRHETIVVPTGISQLELCLLFFPFAGHAGHGESSGSAGTGPWVRSPGALMEECKQRREIPITEQVVSSGLRSAPANTKNCAFISDFFKLRALTKPFHYKVWF